MNLILNEHIQIVIRGLCYQTDLENKIIINIALGFIKFILSQLLIRVSIIKA